MGMSLAQVQNDMQPALTSLLETEKPYVPTRLWEAMHYALISNGKQLRPYLACATAQLFDLKLEQIMPIALSVECVHSYSLIHDDLPCMDDADLRRGKPTVHKKFDEATALLAGSALFTLAFKVIQDAEYISPTQRSQLSSLLANASGARGMIGGQMLDLLGENQYFNLEEIQHMQKMKTGALIQYAVEATALLGNATSEENLALKEYAQALGLAYQIADDLLDVEATSVQTGKTVGSDAMYGKSTFVSLLGVQQAKEKLKHLIKKTHDSLDGFGSKANSLRDLVDKIILCQ